jgi:tetratricopeptide (TPR) repeat protein
VQALYEQGAAHYNRLRQADNDSAILFFRAALAADPSHVRAQLALALAYNQRVITYRLDRANLDSAQAAAERAVTLDPELLEAQISLANLDFSQGRWRSGIPRRRGLQERAPDNASTNSLLGVLLWHIGELPDALHYLHRSLAINPNAMYTPWNIAYVHWYLEQPDSAIRWFEQALAINPSFTRAHGGVINVLLSVGEYDAAIARARRVLAEEPDNPQRKLILAGALLHAGELPEAQALYEEAGPGPALALIYRRQGRVADAERLLDQALANNNAELVAGNEGWVVTYGNAQVHAIRGETAAALAALEESIARGWVHRAAAMRDPLLASLHGDPRFRELMEELGARIRAMRRASLPSSPVEHPAQEC